MELAAAAIELTLSPRWGDGRDNSACLVNPRWFELYFAQETIEEQKAFSKVLNPKFAA
jgi:hypothetical protein